MQYSNACGVLAHLRFGVHSTLLPFGVLAHHRCADTLVCYMYAHPIFYSVDITIWRQMGFMHSPQLLTHDSNCIFTLASAGASVRQMLIEDYEQLVKSEMEADELPQQKKSQVDTTEVDIPSTSSSTL